MLWIFFFQAEDGIRDKLVTGVQTCALPISLAHRAPAAPGARHAHAGRAFLAGGGAARDRGGHPGRGRGRPGRRGVEDARETQVTLTKWRALMFSVVMLRPQVPQASERVKGSPLRGLPAPADRGDELVGLLLGVVLDGALRGAGALDVGADLDG